LATAPSLYRFAEFFFPQIRAAVLYQIMSRLYRIMVCNAITTTDGALPPSGGTRLPPFGTSTQAAAAVK
jgi:hypothetical protein